LPLREDAEYLPWKREQAFLSLYKGSHSTGLSLLRFSKESKIVIEYVVSPIMESYFQKELFLSQFVAILLICYN